MSQNRVEAVLFAAQGEKYLGTPYSQMDCQAFVERMLRDVGIHKDLPGSNAWFRQMTWVGTPEDAVRLFGEVPVGAFLFIHAHDGGEVARGYTDGKGNASHMGVKTGTNGGAIHSSASRGQVACSEFHDRTIHGGWNRVGLWNVMRYNDLVDAFFGVAEEESTEESTEEDTQNTSQSATTDAGKVMTDREEHRMTNAIIRSENGLGANLRCGKSTSTYAIAKLPEGAAISVTADDGTWCEVFYGTHHGYVMRQFVEMQDAAKEDEISFPRAFIEEVYAVLGEKLYGGAVG